MTVVEFLSHLRSLDARLWMEGERLRVSAPSGVLTADLRAELATRKAELIAFLSQAKGAVQATTSPIPPAPRDGQLPLSFSQQRLWFLDQLESNNPAYNIPAAVRLSGPVNLSALEASLNEIVRRHEALRTTFAQVNGQAVQVIAPALTLPLPAVDLQALSPIERESEARRLAAEEAQRPFELTRGSLVRITRLHLGTREHVLLLTLHHAISDDWSMGVLVRELAALYRASAAGKPSPLTELPIQYADFAVWQRSWLQGEVLAAQIAYWKQQLDGVPELPELPTDRPRPPVQTFQGERQAVLLTQDLVEPLKAFSQQEGGTLFMTLLAAFKVLLHQYTGQTDIAIGSPVANRNRSEIEGLIGFFVNTVVLHTDLAGDPTFRELTRRVRQVTVGAYAHQDLPFERLVEALQPERDLGRNPLFQVFFNMLAFASEEIALPGLKIEPLSALVIGAPAIGAKFDMTMYVIPHQERLQLDIFYNADLFEGATIAWLLRHFQVLLERVAAQPDQRLSALPRLTAGEGYPLPRGSHRARLAGDLGLFDRQEIEQSIPHRFEKQVRAYPQNIAIKTRDSEWTYAALNRSANRVARTLLERCGNGPGQVALLFEQGAPLIVAVLGALKAGKAYVPLAPSYPQERLAYMLQDSQASVVLTNSLNLAYARELTGDTRQVINSDEIAPTVSGDDVNLAIAPEAITYILYTSGSTGQPKGTTQNHRNVLHFIMNYTNGLHITAQDRLSLLYSSSFSAAVMDTFAALLNGATLCPFDILQEGIEELAGWLREQQITVYHSVPTVFRHFVGTLSPDVTFPALRAIDLGGEPVSKRDVELYKRHFSPTCLLVNGYGATELNVIRQYFIDKQTDISGSNVPVGYAVPGTEILLLDRDGKQIGFNRAGEIAIKSCYLCPGYWHKPQFTQAAFAPDPGGGSERIYRTGDLGRMRPEGCLEHLGREDFQVKVRGHRIEVAEIEVALLEHSSVWEVVVLAQEDGAGNKRLVAYVVPQGEAPATDQLRCFLGEKLPDYMLPSTFVMLEALPLTPNGKVDRRALPTPQEVKSQVEQDLVLPRTPSEEVLAGIWADILKIEQVGVYDSFFELGGHSLLATQVISRVRDAFQVELSLRELFDAFTVANIAGRIETARRAQQGLSLPSLQPVARDGPLPLSFAQQRLWFLEQLQPGNPAYHMPAAVRSSGPLDLTALQRSLNEVIRRHETLRTTFVSAKGQPTQVIAPALTPPLPVVDLEKLDKTEQESEVRRLAAAETQRPFDLARGPLVRFTLLQLDEAEHVLLLTMHHIISDGWSVGVLLREMVALYQALSTDKPSPLSALPIQYVDYAVWQREWLPGQVWAAQLAYWREQLSGAPALLDLPTDRPRPAIQTYRGDTQTFVLARKLSGDLKSLSQREGVTLFMTLLAAFKALLCRYTGQSDIVVGSPIANRNQSEIEPLIGFFVNTLVLRTRLSGDPSFREILRRLRETALGAYAHQDLPFEQLVEELQPQRDMSRSPLYQVMFVLQNAPIQPLALPDLTLSPLEIAGQAAQFDLTLAISETEAGLTGTLTYNVALFDAATIARLAKHYHTLTENMVSAPGQHLADLLLLTDAERYELLTAWNDTGADYPQEQCIHGQFETQAAHTPDATAVVFHDHHLTYRELNHRANGLAHYLRTLGVGPEVCVGICTERSLEMVTGLYAILKAGGAYVPLDPTYPPERLAFMLADAQVPVLLTQQRLVAALPAHQAQVVCLDAAWPVMAAHIPQNPASDVAGENLAYVIYTSGSTGQPKGAMNTHGGIRNRLQWMQTAYQLTPTDRVMQKTPFSFDVSVWEFFWPLLNGACLVVARPEGHKDSAYLVGLVVEQEVTTLHFVPSMLQVFVEEASVATCRSLKRVVCSGEALPFDLQARFFARLEAELHNLYGPTEAAVDVTFWPCERQSERRAVPIGRPIANTQIHLLDGRWQPVPVGVPGELHIGGLGLARGYWQRAGLTADKFVPDPFSPEPGARLYKTGDLVRRLADGSLEFLGRLDYQIKVRGFRIELGEIEAVLSGHPALRETVVLAREDAPGDRRLVAYVVPREEAPAIDELRRFLGEKLPDYMLPSAFVPLDALPLTPSGKVDRRALPAPEGTRPELQTVYVSPRSEAERIIASIWEEILHVERVGVNDNFFDLGGHSLLVVQVHARLMEKFQTEFPMTDMFKYTTVAALAQNLSQAQEQTDIVQKTQERAAARRASLRQRDRGR